MSREWDESELISAGFERIYVELERYDGPRAGLADINSQPHYFDSRDCKWGGSGADEYRVWPASEAVVAWEREQWEIFARWNRRRDAGTAPDSSHPGHGGVDARYDELTELLAPSRQVPADARRLLAELRYDAGDYYRIDGTCLWFRWHQPQK